MQELSKSLKIKGISETNLRINRLFNNTYPQIRQTLSDELLRLKIRQTLSDESLLPDTAEIVTPVSEQISVPAEKLLSRLSFSHITELISITDPLKRVFYEIESVKGIWSVRELRRQINSLYYERSGLSKNREKLSAIVAEKAQTLQPSDIIKSVYAFEFLGLRAKEVVEEHDLETALLDHLNEFLLELGHGFCFEARQQKILIGDKYYFIDLVFYHRILKCHLLVDLKMEEFDTQTRAS